MAEDQIYLTLGREKQKGTELYLAVLSSGSPQLGDQTVRVHATQLVTNMKEAKAWKRTMLLTKPWIARN